MWPFKFFLVLHIVAGAFGLAIFWVAVLGRKGAPVHRYWGRWFAWLMMFAASQAFSMAVCTLRDPLGTHPHLHDAAFIRGVFGWMMIYLALLTVSLAWHGLRSVRNKLVHERNRQPFDLGLQLVVVAAALNCAWQGWQISQPLMLGMPVIGLASAATNLWFSLRPRPLPHVYLMEHVKAMVGAGISVYTAFTAFGAVHLLPKAALSPVTWSIPCLAGIAMILWHWSRIRARQGLRGWPRRLATGT